MTRQPISIWQPVSRAGEPSFVRPASSPFGDHYAARKVIPGRKEPGTHRVCLFGESVAAGYLYAPHLTPAIVLQRRLQASGGHYEVVDLARTNETLASLVGTVEQSMQLEPDTLVVFAGNNWNLLETPEVSPHHPSPDARSAYGAALAEGGVYGPIELAARRRLQRAATALARIAEIARAGGASVILVVPEVNLADWESRQPVPWLAGDGTARWHRRYASATAALATEQWDAALGHARHMFDLDGGAAPSTYRIMSRAHRGLGDVDRARSAAEAEVASDHYASMCFLGSPRAGQMDQEVQRRAAREHGFGLVDLPTVFRRLEPLPGRRLFLDYCHLTAEGMHVAMGEVAATIARVLVDLPATDVTAAVEATARLGAAVHSAHRLLAVDPGNDVIRYWIGASRDADLRVADTMHDLVAARAAPGPEVVTAAQQRNVTSPHPLGYQHGWRFDHLDAVLLTAIDPAPDLLAAAAGRVDLWEPAARFHPEVAELADVTAPAFLRCPWPEARYAFVAPEAGTARLSITVRSRPGIARLAVNELHRVELAVGRQWLQHRVEVPAHPGLNELTIEWPELPPDGEKQLAAAADRLERGLAADIHPVFGEVWSVVVA